VHKTSSRLAYTERHLLNGVSRMALCSIKCFGVGDGFPTADRGHSAFLYRLGGQSLMIDCGDGLTAHYEAAGLSYDQFAALLIPTSMRITSADF